MAVRCGAAAVGLVSAMPSGPGVIGDDLIAAIARSVPPGVASFLLTSHQTASQIIDQQRKLRTNTVQICDRLSDGTYAHLRDALPGIGLVQVVHVAGEDAIDEAIAVSKHVDAVLLDSGNQKAAIKELGGTGRRHDWQISRRIREAVDLPVYLAGGLRAENVVEAIETVRPFGLDVCSGVRTAGLLDPSKLEQFFKAVRAAAAMQ